MGKKNKLLTREEYDQWYKKLPKDICTFCKWEDYQTVLKEYEYWVWVANLAPYWKYHTLIVSKRHFEKFSDMTFKEAGELTKIIDHGEKKIIDAKLKRDDGSLIEKVVYFWRYRFNRYDPVSGTVRPGHFHMHLVPDRDHLWDKIIDEEANNWDINILKER